MIDSVASILAPLLGLAGSAGTGATVSPPVEPAAAGSLALATRPGLLAPIVLPSIQFAYPSAASAGLVTAAIESPVPQPAAPSKPGKAHDSRQLAFDFGPPAPPVLAMAQAAGEEPAPAQ